jgi:metal-responsive CopG/Arc/MetJ family transcriptional regulator
MIRTQIYLTIEEMNELKALSYRTGKKQSELIREAVDEFLVKRSQTSRQQVLNDVAGIWQNRNDLPDFSELRIEWDRNSKS